MAHSRPDNLLSKQEEKRLIRAGQRVLLNGGYPNPERAGCPGEKVLEAIAFREIPLNDALDCIDHMGYCSPCFIEYTAFRNHALKRKRLEFALAGAALIIVLGVGGWLWKAKRGHEVTNQPLAMTLDLRNWIVPRGDETPSANSGPIQVPRGHIDLTVYLPSGKPAGSYEVVVSTESRRPLINAVGNAAIKNGITVMTVRVDLSKIESGSYVFSIGKLGTERRSYPLVVK